MGNVLKKQKEYLKGLAKDAHLTSGELANDAFVFTVNYYKRIKHTSKLQWPITKVFHIEISHHKEPNPKNNISSSFTKVNPEKFITVNTF